MRGIRRRHAAQLLHLQRQRAPVPVPAAALAQRIQQLFGQLSTEAEEDFHALFGRAFLQAYEGHLAQLKAADRPGGA